MQADYERMMKEGPPKDMGGGKGGKGRGPGSPKRPEGPKPNWAEVVGALVGAGVNPNGTNPEGVSFLMMASDMGATEVCDALLRGGAELRFRDKGGLSALTMSCFYGHTETAAFLVDKATRPHSGYPA